MAELLNLTVNPRGFILDRRSIERSIQAGAKTALNKSGAYIRRSAKASIKRRKRGISEPGQPPISHTGAIKRILYAYDPRTRTVVVGPLPFGLRGAGVLEYGGVTRVKQPVPTSGGGYRIRIIKMLIRARPFMRPALSREAASGKLASAWKNVMKRK